MENVRVKIGANGLPNKIICNNEEFSVTDALFCRKMQEIDAYAYKIRLLLNDYTIQTMMLYQTAKDFLIDKPPRSKKHQNHRYYVSKL